MTQAITPIGLSGVNCYLLRARDGFVLIDTGLATKRAALETALATAGCTPERLNLIVLTHGDVDHAGNAAYLQEKYGAGILMHAGDERMVRTGNMGTGRKPKPDKVTATGRFIRIMGTLMELSRRGSALETFAPDVLGEDGCDLGQYGIDATIVHPPGHSPGSLGVLTAEGDLFCGDLLYNWRRPSVPIIDDAAAHAASMRKLRGLRVTRVYPGHGKPFAWAAVA